MHNKRIVSYLLTASLVLGKPMATIAANTSAELSNSKAVEYLTGHIVDENITYVGITAGPAIVIEDSEEGREDTPVEEADKTVGDYIQSLKKDMEDAYNNGEYESYKQKVRDYMDLIVEFLFYDGEIMGISREQISKEFWITLMQDMKSLSDEFNRRFPGAEETLSRTAQIVLKAIRVLLVTAYGGILDIQKYVQNLVDTFVKLYGTQESDVKRGEYASGGKTITLK